MRTKVLLGLAALAVGLSTSVAQNVYSLNVVGYINVAVKGGAYTLCANQLNNGTNGINAVLAAPPDSALVLKFKNNNYVTDVSQGGAWYDYSTTLPSTTTLNPGEGFFYNNPGTTGTITLVGEVPQGSGLTVNLPSGYALVGTYVPEALELSTTNGFPMVDSTLFLSYDNNANKYVTDVVQGGAWYDYTTTLPATVIPAVGQGYFINNPVAATAWSINFTVQ
jgi:hypothetical protein